MKIYQNPTVVASASFSLLALIISVFMAAVGLYGVTGQIVINVSNNGLPFLGYASDVISLLIIFGAVILMNSVLIFEVYNRKRFIAYALSAANVVISVIVLAAVYMIVSLN